MLKCARKELAIVFRIFRKITIFDNFCNNKKHHQKQELNFSNISARQYEPRPEPRDEVGGAPGGVGGTGGGERGQPKKKREKKEAGIAFKK